MLEKISLTQIKQLHELRLNLDHLWALDRLVAGKPVDEDSVIVQGLKRKLFLVDNTVTPAGKEFYEMIVNMKPLDSNISAKAVIKKQRDAGNAHFNEWWKVYPSSNEFTYKGKNFAGLQKKNLNKTECCAKFMEITATGEFTPEQVIEGTKNHIETAKEQSFRTGDNKLTYIPNSLRYLRERYFEPFINKKVAKQEDTTMTGI